MENNIIKIKNDSIQDLKKYLNDKISSKNSMKVILKVNSESELSLLLKIKEDLKHSNLSLDKLVILDGNELD